jgi:lipopolysaccharide transport system permease protein
MATGKAMSLDQSAQVRSARVPPEDVAPARPVRPRVSVVLEPGRAERRYWRDLWEYRELLFFLAWRDVAVHYKQTLIGVAWAIIRPLLTVVIFTIIFGRIARLPADGGVWYPLLVLAGMLPWQFFATALGESANSLVANSNLISKVYFPRMLVPLSSVGVPLVDLGVSLPLVGLLMAYQGVVPPWQVVLVPLFILLAAAAATGFGLLLCALNVRYRDVRYVIPFLVQFGLFLSPVGFSTAVVPEEWRLLFHLNPMVFAIDGMRWSLLGVGDPFAGGGWVISLAVTVVLIVLGVRYFRKTERTFADVI